MWVQCTFPRASGTVDNGEAWVTWKTVVRWGKGHACASRHQGRGVPWTMQTTDLEHRDLAACLWTLVLLCSAAAPCHLASPWTPCAPTVVSLCADEFSGCYVLQPPESKPNFTPLAIMAHVLGAIQPYAHLIHVQRLIPRQVCCRVGLIFCCCCCSLIGLVLSSRSVQPPRQLCSLPSKPALAFWQARRSGSWRLQVKPRMVTDVFPYADLVRDIGGLLCSQWFPPKKPSQEAQYAWPCMAILIPFLTLTHISELISGAWIWGMGISKNSTRVLNIFWIIGFSMFWLKIIS